MNMFGKIVQRIKGKNEMEMEIERLLSEGTDTDEQFEEVNTQMQVEASNDSDTYNQTGEIHGSIAVSGDIATPGNSGIPETNGMHGNSGMPENSENPENSGIPENSENPGNSGIPENSEMHGNNGIPEMEDNYDLLEELKHDDLTSVEDEYGILKELEDVSAEELVEELNNLLREMR